MMVHVTWIDIIYPTTVYSQRGDTRTVQFRVSVLARRAGEITKIEFKYCTELNVY